MNSLEARTIEADLVAWRQGRPGSRIGEVLTRNLRRKGGRGLAFWSGFTSFLRLTPDLDIMSTRTAETVIGRSVADSMASDWDAMFADLVSVAVGELRSRSGGESRA